jgi:hypothetical protein
MIHSIVKMVSILGNEQTKRLHLPTSMVLPTRLMSRSFTKSHPLTSTDINELQRWLVSDNDKLVGDDFGIRVLQEVFLIVQESFQLLRQSPLAEPVVGLECFELRLDTLF